MTIHIDYHCRDEALALLHTFGTRILPGIVRRIAAWKRIPLSELGDLTEELRQELSVDCLQHAQTLVDLPADLRHARWIRHAERWVYRYRVSLGRGPASDLDDHPAPPWGQLEPPSLLQPTGPAVWLANGRFNMTASARRTGRNLRSIRRELEETAERLGQDDDYLGFWRRRLGEALTGLAADLLRDQQLVSLLHRQRVRPDPRGRLRRIRRIGARILVRRATIAERRVLSRWMRRPRLDEASPRRLLENAVELCPQQAGGWLWLFEACLAGRDLGGAAAALRGCRGHAGGDRCGVLLARARLLEARGRLPAALRLLARARGRWPHEVRLRLALATINAAG